MSSRTPPLVCAPHPYREAAVYGGKDGIDEEQARHHRHDVLVLGEEAWPHGVQRHDEDRVEQRCEEADAEADERHPPRCPGSAGAEEVPDADAGGDRDAKR